jgi:hypothetical protein
MADLIAILSAIIGVFASIGGSLMLAAREDHKQAARISFCVAGVAFWFMGVIMALDISGQRLSIRMGVAAIIGAAAAAGVVWAVSLTAADAQNPPSQQNVASPSALPSSPGGSSNAAQPNSVTGATIEGNSQGGAAAEIRSNGTPNNPSTGADINVTGPGQSITGSHVIQSGPGTGLSVIQSGSGTGLKLTVGGERKPD